MKLTNPWVGYLERSYEQISTKIRQQLPITNPELTDHSPNNPLMIFIDIFAGVTEMLNYYVDSWARESFLQTAELMDSIIQLAVPWDYRIKARSPEMVDVLFTLSQPAPAGGASIPQGTQLQGAGFRYITTTNLVIPEGSTEGFAGAEQTDQQEDVNVGVSDGRKNIEVVLGANYAHQSAFFTIDGEVYTEVGTFAYSTGQDPHFIVNVNANLEAVARFGDGINGKIPPAQKVFLITFRTTEGPAGMVGAGELDTIITNLDIPGVDEVTVTNPNPSSGGSYTESIDSIKKNGPVHIRTIERAVTYADYRQLAEAFPGVDKSEVDFCCGKTVDVVIAPTAGPGGAIASQALLNAVEAYFEDKRMYTTTVNATAAGLSQIILHIEATAKYRRDIQIMKQDIQEALLLNYNYQASTINRKIRTSDLIALVDNLEKVDYMEIIQLALRPYAKPIDHKAQLDWSIDITAGHSTRTRYEINHNQPDKFILVRDSQYMGVFSFSQTYQDESVTFTINPSTQYQLGNAWEFIAYPTNEDIEVEDYSVPLLLEENLAVQVYNSTENTNCKTNCNGN